MILRAHIEAIPADNAGKVDTVVRDVEVKAATYEEGRGLLDEHLHDGERLITARVAEA